jgi:hypothetical protein
MVSGSTRTSLTAAPADAEPFCEVTRDSSLSQVKRTSSQLLDDAPGTQ